MTYYTCINNVNNVGAICPIRMSRQKTLKYLGSFFQSPGRPKKKVWKFGEMTITFLIVSLQSYYFSGLISNFVAGFSGDFSLRPNCILVSLINNTMVCSVHVLWIIRSFYKFTKISIKNQIHIQTSSSLILTLGHPNQYCTLNQSSN